MLNKQYLRSSSAIKNIDGYYYTKLTIGKNNYIYGFDTDGSIISNSNITPPIDYFNRFFLILDKVLYDYIQAGSPTEYDSEEDLVDPVIKIDYAAVDYSKPAVIINGYGFYKDDFILTPTRDNSPEAVDKYQKNCTIYRE